MKIPVRPIACLTVAALATSCTLYKVKELDATALAARAAKARVVGVRTAGESFVFPEDDPATIRDAAVVGSARMTYKVDPGNIADVAPGAEGPDVLLKDGSRFRVTSARPMGGVVECAAVRSVVVPLDEVLKAKVRVKDTAASIAGSIAAGVVFVGVALVAAVLSDQGIIDECETVDMFIDALPEEGNPPGGRRANSALLGLTGRFDTAESKEFWIMEWTPIEARPGADGRVRVGIGNGSGVPRGIDEARLVVVDHPPGGAVAPDVLGALRWLSDPAPPGSALEKRGGDRSGLVSARDGIVWPEARSIGGRGETAAERDELGLSFPRPKGARKAKLVVDASNSDWPALFARQVKARTPMDASTPYQEGQYGKLRVELLTAFGWRTGQALFAVGPLPAASTIYDLDLGDVGGDTVRLHLSPPAGYWLIDRMALDFGQDRALDASEIAAVEADGPDAAQVLEALAVEDGTTFFLETSAARALLTFPVPPPKQGMERTIFLRTVSCYEMPAPGNGRPGKGGGL